MSPELSSLQNEFKEHVPDVVREIREGTYIEEENNLRLLQKSLEKSLIEVFANARVSFAEKMQQPFLTDTEGGKRRLNFLAVARMVELINEGGINWERKVSRPTWERKANIPTRREYNLSVEPWAQNISLGNKKDSPLFKVGFVVSREQFSSVFPEHYQKLAEKPVFKNEREWDGSQPLVFTEDGEDLVLSVSLSEEVSANVIDALDFYREREGVD
jgi:hypothetical protein